VILCNRERDIVITHEELHFYVAWVQFLYDGANLATQEVLLRYRFQKCHNVE
jgi:hypothetical protein